MSKSFTVGGTTIYTIRKLMRVVFPVDFTKAEANAKNKTFEITLKQQTERSDQDQINSIIKSLQDEFTQKLVFFYQ